MYSLLACKLGGCFFGGVYLRTSLSYSSHSCILHKPADAGWILSAVLQRSRSFFFFPSVMKLGINFLGTWQCWAIDSGVGAESEASW